MTRPELLRLAEARDGRGTPVRCPAHDDRNPSLSLSMGEKGRILIKCHTGCSAESVVTAWGLTLADLMPNRERIVPSSVAITKSRRRPSAR